MNRLTVIQLIINKLNANNYLEIGVQDGQVLFRVNVANKFGIDPRFNFELRQKINNKQVFNKANLYEVTSDVFFSEFAQSELKDGLDVVFIDGLHVYKQVVKDVENSLKYLNPRGIIVLHDCNPLSSATAYPVKKTVGEAIYLASKGEIPGWNGSWNGDVWKALVHLRIERDDLEIFTLDLDWGLGVIRFGPSEKITKVNLDELLEAQYSFLEMNREYLLNLKHPKYIFEFLENM